MERYTAEDECGIRELAGRLDYWVDIKHRIDRGDGTVVLPLLRSQTRRRFGMSWEKASAEPAGRLVIHEVLGVEIKDDAEIGTYDVDEVSYDAARGTLTLRSGAPMELIIRVQRPRVELELD